MSTERTIPKSTIIELRRDGSVGMKYKPMELIGSGGSAIAFSATVLDVNDLKKINDTLGHQAGDQYIRDACKLICDIFKRSPVFSTGGDEFTVIVQGDDFANSADLMNKMLEHNREALANDGIVIACGMARYENDACVASVFERADQIMYDNKSDLKEGRFN